MYFWLFFLVALVVEVTAGGKYLYKKDTQAQSILEYTETEGLFEESTHPRVVEFYSPSCGACRAFKPHYIALAKELQEKHDNIEVYGVSCVAHRDMCKKYKVKGYPSIFVFRENSSEHIESSTRKAKGILEALQLEGSVETNINPMERNVIEGDSISNERLAEDGGPTAQGAPDETNKYKDIIRQKMEEKKLKQQQRGVGLRAKVAESKAHPKVELGLGQVREGATNTMKANTPGTPEYEARRKEILERIERRKKNKVNRGKTTSAATAGSSTGTIEKLPYKKEMTKPKVAEKLPIVKQFTHMSNEEELITDASLSLIQGLKSGIFIPDVPLNAAKKRNLKDWLDLMAVSLPPEWSLRDLIDDLHANFDTITLSSKNMAEVLARHPLPRKTWSKSCSSSNSVDVRFHCGFWKLLHIVSIGIAEHKGGQNLIDADLIRPDAKVFSPLNAVDTLKGYMANFFTCKQCREKFLRHYEDCGLKQQCTHLTDFAHNATSADWKGLSLWLWEFHNKVSVSLFQDKYVEERQRKIKAGETIVHLWMEGEIKALWPTLDECFVCYRHDGAWNIDAVFAYLEKTYWPDSGDDHWADLLLHYEDDDDVPHGSRFTIFLVCFGVLLLFVIRRNLSNAGLQQTIVMAKTLRPRGVLGQKKRSV